MVRASCCEKIGLKKGLWTHEEDQILISYIQKHGHSNWRSLPKQAGLLRCGKSCRLRWINYLRPGIKRGNFTNEEEETIIKLHEKLGNRWSIIAAKLPGRTDNEIKNVWYTILRKRLLKPNQPNSNTRRVSKPKIRRSDSNSITLTQSEQDTSLNFHEMKGTTTTPLSTYSSDFSSITASDEGKNKDIESLEKMPEIDENFWSEEAINSEASLRENYDYGSNFDDGMDFWYDVFIRSGESKELPQF